MIADLATLIARGICLTIVFAAPLYLAVDTLRVRLARRGDVHRARHLARRFAADDRANCDAVQALRLTEPANFSHAIAAMQRVKENQR